MKLILYLSILASFLLFFSLAPQTKVGPPAIATITETSSIVAIDLPTMRPKNEQTDWGNWTQLERCFGGLDFRVRRGSYNQYAGEYNWKVQFRNRYYEKIYFSFEMVPYSQRAEILRTEQTTNRTSVPANSVQSGTHWDLIAESSTVYVFVNSVRFGTDGLQSYADCDK